MGLKLETGKQSRKFAVVSIRTCCRSIFKHPFLVGMVFSLIFLYRTFPFLFSLLVYASPVLLCTAVLLGTLLSFGQSNNIHEIEKQEYHSHSIDPLKPGVSESDIVVVNRDERLLEGKKSDTVENSIEEASSIVSKVSKVEDVEDDHVPIKEVETRESNGGVHEGKPRIKGVLHNEKADANQNSLVEENGSEILEVEVENYPRVSAKDHLDDDDDDDDSENRSMYSGSERAESSSVDGSTADMVPMLDETHPLLFREDPQPEIHGEEEDDGVDDNEDDEEEEEEEEEEEANEVKEDESKSAIKWTEDDQKNIMNLGTLELERNQCVENLIARRRAWQSSKTMSQKNLIDFESAEFPFSVSPLSVTRRNPFEFPHDSTNPGSAPTIMLPRRRNPRRNPFELRFESKEVKEEEKNDNKDDGFEQQSTTSHQKDIFFRRHESFSLGLSSLGFVKQENQDIKWRPVFIPERFVSEGTRHFSISRQSSGASDSKLSSIPDSESVSSVEQDFSKEKEMISNLYQTSNLVEHGSQSTEDVVSEEMVQIEKKHVEHVGLEITLGQVENHSEKEVGNQSETESSVSETEEEDNDVEVENKTSETHLETEPDEEEESFRSSLSSISEFDEKNSSHVQNEDGSSKNCLEADNGDHVNGVVDENLPEEPVYDASPTAAGKSHSLISIFSDTQTEILENVKPPESEEMGVVVEEEKPEV